MDICDLTKRLYLFSSDVTLLLKSMQVGSQIFSLFERKYFMNGPQCVCYRK